MAADKPAKAPPLYEGGPDKSTASLATSSLRAAMLRGNPDWIASLRSQ
jgi:hypothetical protein